MNGYPITQRAPAVPPNSWQADNRWIVTWRRRSFLELGAYDTSPRTARGHLQALLPEWGLGQYLENGELISSELITNSVNALREARHEAGLADIPPVRMWVLGTSTQVMLLVWDALRALPQPRKAGPDDISGRGLFLVRELSAMCGCYFPAGDGKVTWSVIGGQ